MGRPSTSSCTRPILLLLLAILVLHESSSLADGAADAPVSGSLLVEKTCKDTFDAEEDECIRWLNSEPRTKNVTDARELVVIAVDLTRAKVSETTATITELRSNLMNCLRYYKEMGHNLKVSMKAIRTGGDLTAVSNTLGRITSAPDDCDIVLFESNSSKNPLEDDNIRAKNLAALFSKLFESKFGR